MANIQQVSFDAPLDLEMERRKIDRSRKMAEMLQQQAMQPGQQGQMVSGHYVAPSPISGLAKILQGYAGRTGLESADKQDSELGRKSNQMLAQGLQGYQQALQGTPEQTVPNDASGDEMTTMAAKPGDKQAALAQLLQSGHPMLQQFGMQQMLKGPGKFSTTPQYDQQGRAFVMSEDGGMKYLNGVSARDKAEFVNGQAVNPYQTAPGTVIPKQADMAGDLLIPDGQGGFAPNQQLIEAKKGIAKSGATNLSVNQHAGSGDKKYAEERMKGRATAADELEKSAANAHKQIQSLDRFIESSKDGAAGGAQPMITAVQGFLSSFGYDSESLKDTRMMEQAIGDILGSKMAELGARGLTDQDMKILREALPRVATDRKSREAIADVLKRSHMTTLGEYQNMRDEEAKIYPELATRVPEPAWYKAYKSQAAPPAPSQGSNVRTVDW